MDDTSAFCYKKAIWEMVTIELHYWHSCLREQKYLLDQKNKVRVENIGFALFVWILMKDTID